VLATKSVNSVLYATPDLHAWLQEGGFARIAMTREFIATGATG
jgi:hypothetical protein